MRVAIRTAASLLAVARKWLSFWVDNSSAHRGRQGPGLSSCLLILISPLQSPREPKKVQESLTSAKVSRGVSHWTQDVSPQLNLLQAIRFHVSPDAAGRRLTFDGAGDLRQYPSIARSRLGFLSRWSAAVVLIRNLIPMTHGARINALNDTITPRW